jgi:hypothetical protein
VAYGSSGEFGPAPLTAIDVQTGGMLWQDRAFPKANLVFAGGKVLILDEDLTLALAELSPRGLQVKSLRASQCRDSPAMAGARL